MMMSISENLEKIKPKIAERIKIDGLKHISFKDRKILVIEDNLDTLLLFTTILTKFKATVIGVTDPQQGLKLLKDNPDLTIVDITMGEMNGYDFTVLARKNGHTGKMIAVTAHAYKHELALALESGCDGYMTKPIDLAYFVHFINHELENPLS